MIDVKTLKPLKDCKYMHVSSTKKMFVFKKNNFHMSRFSAVDTPGKNVRPSTAS